MTAMKIRSATCKLLTALALVAAASFSAATGGCKKEGTTAGPGSPGEGGKSRQVIKMPTSGPVRLAFVTNNTSEFWNIAASGVKKFVDEAKAAGHDVTVDVKRPPSAKVAEQNQILEDLVNQGYNGIAVSVIAPDAQVPEVNRAAKKTNVICHDSDCAKSNRLVYIGTNNYEAGKVLGTQIVAMNLVPPGGKVAVFVGSMSADNARERLRGVQEILKTKNIEVLQPKEDGKNDNTARTNVEQVLSGQPDVKLLVGLWSYNGPAIADVLGNSPRKGEVKAAVFDEEGGTLDAIEKGLIACTVVQKPYQFGYQSSKLLYELATGGQSALPAGEVVDTGVTVITSDPTGDKTRNVKEFRDELNKLRAG